MNRRTVDGQQQNNKQTTEDTKDIYERVKEVLGK